MIRPDRHTNLDFSVLNISAFILGQLNAYYGISYDLLLEKVQQNLGDDATENYPYALNFLFILGKLKYSKETDSFVTNEAK
jgi:hypothetical protein